MFWNQPGLYFLSSWKLISSQKFFVYDIWMTSLVSDCIDHWCHEEMYLKMRLRNSLAKCGYGIDDVEILFEPRDKVFLISDRLGYKAFQSLKDGQLYISKLWFFLEAGRDLKSLSQNQQRLSQEYADADEDGSLVLGEFIELIRQLRDWVAGPTISSPTLSNTFRCTCWHRFTFPVSQWFWWSNGTQWYAMVRSSFKVFASSRWIKKHPWDDDNIDRSFEPVYFIHLLTAVQHHHVVPTTLWMCFSFSWVKEVVGTFLNQKSFSGIGVSSESAAALFNLLDSDQNGMVDRGEFLRHIFPDECVLGGQLLSFLWSRFSCEVVGRYQEVLLKVIKG